MANNFKTDDSFLRKLVVGAAGTNATMETLRALGFEPIELERGSTSFKIWKKIKIKRVRVPDILCLKTGLRFESRGKSKVEISMSHSLSDPKRVWDAGMRDDDMVSIVAFSQDEENPTKINQISPVHFVSVRDMRDSFARGQYSITIPKGFEEGSERRVIWTSAIAKQESQVVNIDAGKISMSPIVAGRRQFIRLNRNEGKILLLPQISNNDYVRKNQIVASVVPVKTELVCPEAVDERYFVEKLGSMNLSERYAAAKALRYRGYTAQTQAILVSRMNDADEDIYVQLEAAAALAVKEDNQAWTFLESKLRNPTLTVPLETQLETIIVASEIRSRRSEGLLIDILRDNVRDEELRAGAAWALGQFSSPETVSALVDTFDLNAFDIKVEAARALFHIGESQKEFLLSLMRSVSPNKRDGLAWALAKIGNFDVSSLITSTDVDLRKWVSYIIGFGQDNFDRGHIERICTSDPDIYFAASVLWQILASWINGLKEY
jgi:hypothetical protein